MIQFLISAALFSSFASASDVPGFTRPDLPLVSSHADVTISGTIAHVVLEQVWKNAGSDTVEAVYRFPINDSAAVSTMTMTIGKRILRAEIMEKKKATAKYSDAVDLGKTAMLLGEERPNLLQMRVGNIQPGATIVASIGYDQILRPDRGIYEFRMPGGWTPRYTHGDWVTNPTQKAENLGVDWSVDIDIAAGMPLRALASPSHAMRPVFHSTRAASVSFRSSVDDPGNDRDLLVRYRLAGDQIENGIMLYRDRGDENFFSVIIEAPSNLAKDEIPPRELVFILDTSGSMGGFPLATAKYLVHEMTAGLREQDTVNAIFFAGNSAQMWPASKAATAENILALLRMVDGQSGSGGTELDSALNTAFAMPATSGRARAFVVVTDGAVSFENQLFASVQKRAGQASVFAFGVGNSPNAHLVDGLAKAGGGRSYLASNAKDAKKMANAFMRRVRAPALTRVSLSFPGFDAYDIIPTVFPDVYSDKPLIVTGKYRGAAAGEVVIRGLSGMGDYRARLRIEDNKERPAHSALRTLWAKAKVRDLETSGGEGLLQVALRYSLLTESTSLVVVDEASGGAVKKRTIMQPVPAGIDFSGLSIDGGLVKPDALYAKKGRAPSVDRSRDRQYTLDVLNRTLGNVDPEYGRGKGGAGGRVEIGNNVVLAGPLDKAVIRRVVRQAASKIRYCYEKQLINNPTLTGKLVMSWTINAHGRVTSPVVRTDTMGSKNVAQCMQIILRRLRFPKPRGGGIVHVTYPFVFKPKR